MPRKVKGNWISAYLQYTEETESPKSYHTWTAISIIAGVLGRKVHFTLGSQKIYPNFYILLVGQSGKLRKGVAMGMGEDLFRQTGLDIAAEAITREALLIRMGKAKKNFLYPDSSQGTHSSLTLFSKELTTLTGVRQVKFLADLTDWFDCHDIWVNDTKNKGIDIIEGMFLNILAATAPDWIPQILPLEAVGGGFTSRCIFVVESQKYRSIAMPPPPDAKTRLALIEDLKDMRGITGEYQFTPEGLVAFKAWYDRTEAEAKTGKYAVPDPRLASYCERRAVHLLKLSIILQAAQDANRMVGQETFELAIETLEDIEPRMSEVFGGVGMSELAQITHHLLAYIKRVKVTTQAKVLREFYRDMSWNDLQTIESTMVNMGVVRIEHDLANRTNKYVWIGEGSQ